MAVVARVLGDEVVEGVVAACEAEWEGEYDVDSAEEAEIKESSAAEHEGNADDELDDDSEAYGIQDAERYQQWLQLWMPETAEEEHLGFLEIGYPESEDSDEEFYTDSIESRFAFSIVIFFPYFRCHFSFSLFAVSVLVPFFCYSF